MNKFFNVLCRLRRELREPRIVGVGVLSPEELHAAIECMALVYETKNEYNYLLSMPLSLRAAISDVEACDHE